MTPDRDERVGTSDPKRPKTKKAKKKGRIRSQNFWWRLLERTLAVGVWGMIAMAVVLAAFAYDLPKVDQAALTRTPNIVILDSSGDELMNAGDRYGASVELTDLPPHFIQAVLSIEDRRFFQHG